MSYVSQHNRLIQEGRIGKVLHCSCFIPMERALYSHWIGGGWEVIQSTYYTHARTVRDQCGLQRTTAVVRIGTTSSDI